MAVAIVGSVTTATQGSAASSLALSVPSGVVNGNLLLAFHGNDAGTANALTPPAGWTLVRNENDGGGFTFRLVCYYRIASSEPASYTWTMATGAEAVAICIALSGHETTPTIVSSGLQKATKSTTATTTGLTPSAADDYLLVAMLADNLGATISGTYTQNAALTSQVAGLKPAGNTVMLGLGTQQLASAAATGTRNGTFSVSYANIGIMISVKTAAGGAAADHVPFVPRPIRPPDSGIRRQWR